MRIILILICFLLMGCTSLEGPYIVDRVIDGDTLQLNTGERIRFSGINTPEISSGACYAEEAKLFVKDLVEGEEIYLERDFINEDKYGRSLRYVHYKGSNLNFILIEEGYAKIYDDFKESTKYYEKILDLEERAKISQKGLWKCKGIIEGETYSTEKNLLSIGKIIILILLFLIYIFLNTMLS